MEGFVLERLKAEEMGLEIRPNHDACFRIGRGDLRATNLSQILGAVERRRPFLMLSTGLSLRSEEVQIRR